MSYQIHITQTAERDLNSALDYIEFVLKNPTAADHLLDVVEKEMFSLSDFPMSKALVDDPILQSWGIRFVTVNNYLAFYIVENNTVHIIRFLYGKRDWMTILKKGYDLK